MRISQDVTYQVPSYQNTRLGGTPRDYFNQIATPSESFVSCQDGHCANLPQQVWQKLPVLGADGRPELKTVQEHLEASPYSPTLRALGWGSAGGFAGAALGMMGGLLAGHPLAGVATGATLLGGAAALLGAASARGDQVRLEWVDHSLDTQRYQGYTETVTPGTLNGQSGYYHRFSPQLETVNLGHYQTPRIVHYREER